ncbi:MAG: hypothetical protein L3J91_04470 [Thermoplasmata archaeon]|nr:hypothetical protein [Thermoplasmata archaeon]
MTQLVSPVLRLLDGLAVGSGRTLVIAGPALSGKSDLVQQIRGQASKIGAHVHALRGEHRFRDLPYFTMETFDQATPDAGRSDPESPPPPEELLPAGIAFVPLAPTEVSAAPRRRGDRGRGPQVHFATPRARGPARVEPEEFWRQLVQEVRAPPHPPLLLVVDEGAFVDAESREVLLYISERARMRPIGLVLSLDSSQPSFGIWEERLLGHGDVDWIRLPRPRPDPRDERKAREDFDQLPERCRRVLGLAALLGGPVREVTLSRVTRLNFNQLGDALLPALEAGLVKIDQGKISFAHSAFADQVPERIPPAERAEMHREIAEALAALNPEPSLERRLELAHHYYEWYKGPNALRYLLEAAELTERLHAYDTAADSLEQAVQCVPSLPAPDRREADAEIRLLQFRALAFAGRIPEAERALQEGIAQAIEGQIPADRLEEWVEALVPIFGTIGPRPSLVTLLVELAERCHDVGASASEILFQSVLARYDLDRGRIGKAREEANRAARLARTMGEGPAQALALLAVGITRTEGTPEEQRLAERFLRSAELMLGRARRYGLELEAEEAQLRLREVRGERDLARRARERAIPAAQRFRNLPVELAHQLAIAALLLDGPPDARATTALKRAHEIVETLHLIPPSPALLQLWLLEGRMQSDTGHLPAARDRFEAVAEQSTVSVAARTRAEARLRLAILEAAAGRDDAARAQVQLLGQPELRNALKPEWREWYQPLARRYASEAAYPENEGNAPGSTA